MASLAIGGAGSSMVEIGPTFPGNCIVTLRALTGEVVCRLIRGVAGNTIRCTHRGMVERGGKPGAGAMARGALSGEVVGGFVRDVAGQAIRSPHHGVVECGRSPGIRAVT